MAQLKYCDKHNQVGFLRKPDESAGFAEISIFSSSNLRYALTANPTIYDSLVKQFWQSAIANTKADGSLEINATIDTIRYTISEDKNMLLWLNPNHPHQHLKHNHNHLSLHLHHHLSLHLHHHLSLHLHHHLSLTTTLHTPPLIPTPTPPPITTPTPPPIPTPTPPPITTPTPPPDTEPTPLEHIYEEQSPVHHHFSPPQDMASSQMPMDDLLHEVPKGEEVGKGYEKKELVLTTLKEEPEVQGRKSQDDPLDSSVQGLVTPPTTKVNTSGEEQVEEISPNTLEAAKKSLKVATFKLNTAEWLNTVSTAEGVNTGSIKLNTSTSSQDKGQREGKAPMISEETPKKSKEQILQEEASLAEAIRLDTLQKEEVAKQVHLDSLLAQRIAEEEELNEQQKKRKAQVQFEAQHYTNEDWDLIRVKELKKKYFAEERARAKRNKPMTQSQLKTYMMNYLKNQGTWKLSQLKKLSFEEVKEEFDKLVKQVGEQEESTTTGTETPINPVPVAMKTPSVATYKIIKHGKKGGVNTPGSDENRLKLYDLMYIIVNDADMMDC
ncbi:hypothetical protein Tco_1465623 [Tanacetum coccineum]